MSVLHVNDVVEIHWQESERKIYRVPEESAISVGTVVRSPDKTDDWSCCKVKLRSGREIVIHQSKLVLRGS